MTDTTFNIAQYEWKRCRPWIEAALEYSLGSYTIEDIEVEIARGNFQFWPGGRCALITQIQTYPRRKWLHVPFIGGDFQEIKQMHPVLWSFAKHNGCDGMTGAGRPGWARALGMGWRKSYQGFVWLPD